jgi:phage I-like protein
MGTNITRKLHEGKRPSFGYLTDVAQIRFNDDDRSSWIQLMPLGSYKHPLHGMIEINPTKVSKFVENFKSNVRGIQLDVDYDHKQHNTKAAGWIQDVQDRGLDGLWGLIKWTQPAYTALKEGEYRYFSPEFQDVWENPITQTTHEDVLFGGALTNRPYLKDIQPINLSEVIRASEGGPVVDPEKLRQMLGLPKDATDEQVEAKMAEALAALEPTDPAPVTPPAEPTPGTPPSDPGTPTPPPAPTPAPEPVLASETATQVIQLTEQVRQLQEAKRLSEIKLQFGELKTGKRALAPVLLNEAQAIAVKLSETDSTAFVGLIKKILDGGTVELGERESSRPDPSVGSIDDLNVFNNLITKKLNDGAGKLEFIDALEQASIENPEAYQAYRTAQLNGVK